MTRPLSLVAAVRRMHRLLIQSETRYLSPGATSEPFRIIIPVDCYMVRMWAHPKVSTALLDASASLQAPFYFSQTDPNETPSEVARYTRIYRKLAAGMEIYSKVVNRSANGLPHTQLFMEIAIIP